MTLRPLVLLALLLAPLASGCLEGRASTPAAGPLPLDPLSAEEEARALRLALEDPAVALLLAAERHRVIGAALRTDKEAILSGSGARFADVHVYRYGSDDVVWPVVDLREGRVASISIERFQPRLTGPEVAEAEAAVLRDPRVLAHLGGDATGVRVIAILATGGPLCPVHRCVETMLLRGDEPIGLLLATFDLSAGLVLDVRDAAAEAAAAASQGVA